VKSVMDGHFYTLEEFVESMVDLYKYPEQAYKNLSKDYLNQKEQLISRIIEAEKIVEQEEKEQKEAEDLLQAKLACIAAVEAAKPKTSSVKVKPISGVSNQGGMIVLGGGKLLLQIEEEHKLPTPLTWMECSGIICSTRSKVPTDTLKCGSKDVLHDKTTGKSKFGEVDFAQSSNGTTSNENRSIDTHPMASTNMSTVDDQSSSWVHCLYQAKPSGLN